ncbi:DUF4235 domain-containing protein [Gleimia sp. 6138-11-ORH1]|uniref:DUF4235 domain-containing protein n=1 Tax=Gleimia sp. 6138-11-ORH1 TaxID=2973937 RepID=UPI00216985DF|nr:DUF4235 domain-containing protein [Gleimia sp. 6138-11-ORH1]MCS4485000.1 DUF4235 domain-containing protein [Gleimia sp. 6138-11-ORH1]
MDVTNKLISLGSVAGAGFVTDKIIDKGWELVTGRPSPAKEDEETVELLEMLVFAAVSAVALTLVRRYVIRGTKKVIAKREARTQTA